MKNLIIGCILFLTLIVTGCQMNTGTASNKKVINVLMFGDAGGTGPTRWELLTAKAFEKEFPQYRINWKMVTYGELQPTIQRQLAGNSDIDVMFMDPQYFPRYAESGSLLDVSGFIERDGLDLKKYYPAAIENAYWKNKIYGLPRDMGAWVLWYNKNMFQKGGLPFPDNKWTWNNMLSAATSLHNITPKEVSDKQFGVQISWEHQFALLNGGEIIDDIESPTRSRIFEKPVVDAYQFVRNIDKFSTGPSLRMESGGESPWQTGRVGMQTHGTWVFNDQKILANVFEADFIPMPMPANGVKRSSLAGTALWVISAKSKIPEGAWEFIKFSCYNEKGQKVLGNRVTPSVKEIAESEWYRNLYKEYSIRYLPEILDSSRFMSRNPLTTRFRSIIENVDGLIRLNKEPIETILANAEKEINAVINEKK